LLGLHPDFPPVGFLVVFFGFLVVFFGFLVVFFVGFFVVLGGALVVVVPPDTPSQVHIEPALPLQCSGLCFGQFPGSLHHLSNLTRLSPTAFLHGPSMFKRHPLAPTLVVTFGGKVGVTHFLAVTLSQALKLNV